MPVRAPALVTAVHASSIWAPVVLMAVVLGAYGFEIFSFTLTLDEELFAAGARTVDAWISEGRWSMAVLYLLVPSAIVPTVSTAIGVGLTALAMWVIGRRYLGLGRVSTAAAVSLAVTVPVLAFLFSFLTIAYGIGVASILCVVWCWGIRSPSWMHRSVGLLAGAATIGIYDSFLAVLTVLSLAVVARRPQWRTAAVAVIALPAALIVSRLAAWLTQTISGVRQESYVGGFIDPLGLLADPLGRTRRALGATWRTLTLSEDRFGLSSPFLIVVLVLLGLLAAWWALRAPGSHAVRMGRLCALGLVACVPVAAEALSASGLNLRSMVYLPFVVLVLAAFAVRGLGMLPRVRARAAATGVLAALLVLAVVGNASITNHLFAAANLSYALDRQLAFTIGQNAAALAPADVNLPFPVVVAGIHAWPESELIPSRETLGVSFFEKTSAGSVRFISFLQVEGVDVIAPSEEQAGAGKAILRDMPAYPHAGWIDVVDGVLLVKLGD